MNVNCPSCFREVSRNFLYVRDRCPVLNNVVYDSPKQARSCVTGMVRLVQCPECGLVLNADFEKDLVVYDESYDNVRNCSSAYNRYLDFIAELCSSSLNHDSTVLEIGCGKGDFLRRLSDVTGCMAVGYDSVYEGEDAYKGRVFFHRSYFRPENDGTHYDMLILRHVLEHVERPYDFMRNLCAGASLKNNARLLIEVPDFEWILKKRTFYDITYEHCNYFFRETLSDLMGRLGFANENVRNVFGEQYLLMHGIYTGEKPGRKPDYSFPAHEELFEGFHGTKLMLMEKIRQAENVCVWGASGKGVVFLSDLSEDVLERVSYVVDINVSKQGKFLPVSGKRVDPPAVLQQAGEGLLVIVMNGIYEGEIRSELDEMGVQASVMTAY